MKRSLEVADIFRAFGPAYRQTHEMPIRHLRVMRAIEICRTAELGGHIDQCDPVSPLGRKLFRLAQASIRVPSTVK